MKLQLIVISNREVVEISTYSNIIPIKIPVYMFFHSIQSTIYLPKRMKKYIG